LWGLIRNHPFVHGDKRTATVVAFFSLERAGYVLSATEQAVLDIVYSIEDGRMGFREIADWFRENIATST
jgi:death-on-curing protein